MTHWSHFPCFKHTHSNQRLERLWVSGFFSLRDGNIFFMSTFHIMLHNPVPAHKSHAAGLTP